MIRANCTFLIKKEKEHCNYVLVIRKLEKTINEGEEGAHMNP